MLTVHRGLPAGLVAQIAVLAVLAGTVGLGVVGALVGLAYGFVVVALLSQAVQRSGAALLGPADVVTLLRSALVGGVAALVADSFAGPVPAGTLAATLGGIAAVALVLDAVDGRVARSTRTVSAVGARFDMEVDSALVLVLSVFVAGELGAWVLVIGSVRYVRLVAGWMLPWLRQPAPPRYWCKVVAAVQGIVLTAVTAGVLPAVVAVPALVLVAAMLAESFGREVWELRCLHRAGADVEIEASAVGSDRG